MRSSYAVVDGYEFVDLRGSGKGYGIYKTAFWQESKDYRKENDDDHVGAKGVCTVASCKASLRIQKVDREKIA
jgi:hypothetical protein